MWKFASSVIRNCLSDAKKNRHHTVITNSVFSHATDRQYTIRLFLFIHILSIFGESWYALSLFTTSHLHNVYEIFTCKMRFTRDLLSNEILTLKDSIQLYDNEFILKFTYLKKKKIGITIEEEHFSKHYKFVVWKHFRHIS